MAGPLLARVRTRLASSLRYRIIALVVLPILLVAPASVGFIAYWSRLSSREQLERRVSADLGVTSDAFARLQQELLASLERLAGSYSFAAAWQAGDRARMAEQIEVLRETTALDFVHLTDAGGRWLLAAGGGGQAASPHSPLQRDAAAFGVAAVGLELYRPADLEGEALRERARIPPPPTLRATAPAGRTVETHAVAARSALVVRAIAPLRDAGGSIVALLDGGALVNGAAGWVDRIRDLVYPPGSLPAGSRGVVTVFLGDTRVSTTVRLAGGRRAIGTRAAAPVSAEVVGRGQRWTGRAWVVDRWYLSAYEPLTDSAGRRIGMLAVGFPEQPFRAAFQRALVVSLGLVAAGLALALWLGLRGARAIFEPVEAIARVVRAVKAGEERRIGRLDSGDEIGELARQFDQMLDLLEERQAAIAAAAERLESEVEARTAELRAQNARLAATVALLNETRERLVASEKLAALGQLTAGVAHEINNPIAVIQGNLEVLPVQLGEHAARVETEIELILEQVARIHAIVDRLLDYARSSVWKSVPERLELAALVDDTLPLVEGEAAARGVRLEVEHREPSVLEADPEDLRQVLLNLVRNAIQASGEGGRVRVGTGRGEHGRVRLVVADQGHGIAPGDLERVFEPFFTTRGRAGTGLGLSLSRDIVRRYGGRIRVRSRPGEGACFEVELPAAAPARGGAAA